MVAHCQSGCDLATSQFASHYNFLQHALDLLALVAPALFGLFWGAPLLARELETGSYRLAWTQSVTRSRWLLTKLGLGALATVTLAGLLTLTITWWYRALDKVGTNQYAVFDRRDLVPIGYALFAFATGALFGALLRRTVPAMVATLVLYVFARVASAIWIRPHLLSPTHATSSLLDADRFGFTARNGAAADPGRQGAGPPGSWTLSSHLATSTGQVPSSSALSTFLQQNCPSIGSTARESDRSRHHQGAGPGGVPGLPRRQPPGPTTSNSATSRPATTGRCSGWRPASSSAWRCSRRPAATG